MLKNDQADEKITAYITKYALTIGILEVEGVVRHSISPKMFAWNNQTAHGKDWHRTRELAVARAEEMRKKKIASLKQRIEQLENLAF